MKQDIGYIQKQLEGMTLHVIPYTHPDWAWCHTREWHELRYVAVFEEVLRLLREDERVTWYMDCFTTELRPLLERKPGLVPELHRAVASGRVAVCGAYSNVRPNMVSDEAYVRNLCIGRKKFAEIFPEADLSVHADAVDVALGHPQIPQLLTKAGYRFFRAGRPYDVLRKKKIPHAFVWEGSDGSRILSWWAQYDAFYVEKEAELINGDGDWEETVCALYDGEIKKFTEDSPVNMAWLPQGGDDSLPLRKFDSGDEIRFTEFMEKWNRRETSKMVYSTPPLFFGELEKRRDKIPVISGTVDPCDVCYNAAWGGEKGLMPLRLKSAERIADAEKWMTFAALCAGGDYSDTEELWEKNLTASAHASQWVFEEDKEELFGCAQNSLAKADELCRKAMRRITENMRLPENTAAVVFNSHDKEVTAAVPVTVSCGKAEGLALCDGAGENVSFQILEPLELNGMVWEYRVIAHLKLPPNGVNCICAAKGDCSLHTGGVCKRREKPEYKPVSDPFTLDNGVLRLEFIQGNLTEITDIRSNTVLPSGGVYWNTLEFVGIDTDRGGLHAGPEVGRKRVVWREYSLSETGPVRWRCSLKGSSGDASFLQDITLEAGSGIIKFNTKTDDFPVCAGYLAARIPAAENSGLYGGIPFGSEEKDIDREPYNGREKDWNDFHRQWDGLFFAKDFAAVQSENCTAALVHISGDRYYIREKENRSLGCLLINCAYPYRDTCEENINDALFQSPGRHRFEHAVIIAGAEASPQEIISGAAFLRREPVVMRPYRSVVGRDTLPPRHSFLKAEPANIMVSAAYRQDRDSIVRLWEADGKRTDGSLSFCLPVLSARAENLIGGEDKTVPLRIEDGTVKFTAGPHEIITLRLHTESGFNMEKSDSLIVTVRPMEQGDTELLYGHFCDLSARSRAKFRPHDFTMETARKFTGEGLLDPDCRRFIAVAEADGAIAAAGYCFIADWRSERPWLGIAVGDRWQGRGVGRKMMETMITEARKNGKKGLKLTTDKDNYAGQALYKKCGFVIVGEGKEDDYKLELEF